MDKIERKKVILKCLVGSRAHGLHTPESDYDYRGVFVVPTADILKVGARTKNTHWIEGQTDDTMYEIGHFLHLATKCNPTILEVFLAEPQDNGSVANMWGADLRALFPYVWNSRDVMNAFIGYGLNQRKKFLDKKDERPHKYATAYLRTLYQAYELLTTGMFTVKAADTEVGEQLKRFKNADYTIGDVIQTAYEWEEKVRNAYEKNPDKETDFEKVNEFLLKVRKRFWEFGD